MELNKEYKKIILQRLSGIGFGIFISFIILTILPLFSKIYSKQLISNQNIQLNIYPENNKIKNSISIMWGNSFNNTQYSYVLLRDGEYFTKFNSNTHSYLDTGLVPYAQYTYQILVVNNQGQTIYQTNKLILSTQNSIFNSLVISPHSKYSTYTAFGDSITQGFETTTSYFDRVSQYLKNKEGTVSYNQGVGGNTTYDLLSRIESELQSENPQLVTLMIGANDIRIGTKNNPTITSLDYKNNMIQIISDINPSPQRTLILFELPPIKDWNVSGFSAGSNQRLIEFNKIIIGLANQYGIPYINLNNLSNIPNSFNSDQLHPNNTGDLYIYNQLVKTINLYN